VVSRAILALVKALPWLAASLFFVGPAQAEETTGDRVAVRIIAPETGGAARPRFLTDREIAFFARVEAMNENVPVNGEYPERYVRAATDRLVARTMLAQLMIQRGSEPPDLPKLAQEARAELAERVGGASALEAAMKREGIEEEELLSFLRDQVRAAFYIDRGITPILTITEDSLREAFRAAIHPFRNMKFDDARVKLRRWVIAERQRSAELEFLQGARARIKIAIVDPAGGSK